jgi:hypothetical protein
MLELQFEGWWQCRFATDPDPTDDPRGVSGPTFTVPGEPPFDRIVRLQDPVMPRYPHEDDIGVNVREVRVGGQAVPGHPLVGAAVSLKGDAEFLQRNLIFVTAPFQVILDPFDLQVEGAGIVLRRAALWDVSRPELRLDDVFLEPDVVTPRINGIEVQSAVVAEATGVMDYEGARVQRAADLRAIRERTTDPTARAALDKRLRALENDGTLVGAQLAATQFMGMRATYDFPLNGAPHVADADGRLGGRVGTSQLWQLRFWLGGYDVDSLCGYMRGRLAVPFLDAAG